MIPCVISIGLAFLWMLYESDWLRIRLPVGASKPVKTIRIWQCNYTDHIKGTSYTGFTNNERNQNPYWVFKNKDTSINLFNVGITEPVCGWEWLLNHEHPIIENRIEIIAHNCKHSIHLCDNPEVDYGKILKEACTIAFKTNIRPKNGHKPNRRKASLTFNPNYKLKTKKVAKKALERRRL